MRTYSRRDVLKQASLAASAAVGASLARSPLLHAAEPASEKLGVAVIGCGDDNDSTTGPTQEPPNIAGLWSFTLTTVSDTTPQPQAPGTTETFSVLVTQSGTNLSLFDDQGTNIGTGRIDPDGSFTLSGNLTQDSIPISFTLAGTADSTGTSATGTGTFIPIINGVPVGAREVTFTGVKL